MAFSVVVTVAVEDTSVILSVTFMNDTEVIVDDVVAVEIDRLVTVDIELDNIDVVAVEIDTLVTVAERCQ